MTYAKIIHHCFLTGKQFADRISVKTNSSLYVSLTCHIQANFFRGFCPQKPLSWSHLVTHLALDLYLQFLTKFLNVSHNSSHLISHEHLTAPVIFWFSTNALWALAKFRKQVFMPHFSSVLPTMSHWRKVPLDLTFFLTLPSFLLCSLKSNGFPLQTSDLFALPALGEE